jgi:hypothetical protein
MNYKRTGARLLFRVRHGLHHGGKVFVALTGASGTAFGLINACGVTCNPTYVVSSLTVAALCGLTSAFIKGHINHLPDSIIINDDHDVKYELCYETKDICKYFNQKTAKYFGRDFIDDLVVESWRTKNPSAFIYLKNQHQKPCAALCVFALRHSFMEQFIKGRVAESDIEEEEILDLAASKKSDTLYLAAIIVEQPHTPVGHRRALIMVWGAIQYLNKVYGMRKKRIIPKFCNPRQSVKTRFSKLPISVFSVVVTYIHRQNVPQVLHL